MGIRRLIGGFLLVIGAIVLGDRLLRHLAGELEPPDGSDVGTVRVRGFDVAYTERGDPEAPDVLLIHDIYLGASSEEVARLGEELASEYHVIEVDLPGFGRSERPPITYDPAGFTHAVETIVEELLDEPTVIASGMGTAFTLDALETASVEQGIAISPLERRWPPAVGTGILLDTPIIGTAIYDLLASRPSLRYHLEHHFDAPTEHLPDGFVDHTWRVAHQRGASRPISAWLAGELDSTVDTIDVVDRAGVPVTLVGGSKAAHPSLDDLRTVAEETSSRLVVVDGVGRAPHLLAPEQLATQLLEGELP